MRIILTTLIFVFSLHAVELNWLHSYKEALTKAKKEQKNVMLLVTSERCGWCRKLEKTTLKDEKVIERLNKNYIVVHLNRGEGDYPDSFKVSSVPATLFLRVDGTLIIKKVVGYWSSEDYLSYLDDVDYKLGKRNTKIEGI